MADPPTVLRTDEHGERIGQEDIPPFVTDQAALDRWNLCLTVAQRITGQGLTSRDVWFASRSIFFSDIPTHPDDPRQFLQDGSEEQVLEEARRLRRDRLGRFADMPDVPKRLDAPPRLRRAVVPPMSPGTVREPGRDGPSDEEVYAAMRDPKFLTPPEPSPRSHELLAGQDTSALRYREDPQPPASPGFDPVRHPVYQPKRAQRHRVIVRRELAKSVAALLGDSHPTALKLQDGHALSEAEKAEVRAAAHRARGGAPPEALFMAGGPASGKTTVLKENPQLEPQFAVSVNPDRVKEALPEYQVLAAEDDPYAASAVHLESGDIAARMFDEAIELGLNAVLDGTGNSPPGAFSDELKRARGRGYDVDVIYVDRPTPESVFLAVRRALIEKRWVPLDQIRKQHRAVSVNFRDEIAKLDWALVHVFDHEGHLATIPRGEVLRRQHVTNEAGFQRFLDKANEADE